MAVPAQQLLRRFLQSDGSYISLIQCGDEYVHFYITIDSIPVFETQKGFCYALLNGDKLHASDVIAHDPTERRQTEMRFVQNKSIIKNILSVKHKELLHKENIRKVSARACKKTLGIPNTYVGNKKGLVVLVNFQNLSMHKSHTQKVFDDYFNKVGYSQNGCIGSVHDYFFDQSYGQFDLTFDVVGPVTVSNKYGYYGRNSELLGQDANVKEMVIEACSLIQSKVNFKDYDWDNDGEVDQVYLIYAGYGENDGAPSNTIWPHESSLGSKSITLDGVKINTYACSSELSGNENTNLNGIGVACHEFSHCLGLPDLYDTDYSGALGMIYWGLMSSGSYSGPNKNGEVPYGYSAYERWFAGWLQFKEISTMQHISGLSNLEESPEAYILYNDNNRNEFYVLENHQPMKWFKYVSYYTDMHGLMVIHVDYDSKVWASNDVNQDPEHQRMAIIPADNSLGTKESDLRGDLFPGENNVRWLTDDSHIYSGGQLFNQNVDGSYRMGKIIGNISEAADGTVSFDVFLASDISIPIPLEATDINDSGYTANWETVDNADSYIVEQFNMFVGSDMIPEIKRQTIDNITATSQRLDWLADEGVTKYRVKSVVNGCESQWSDYVDVSKDYSGIVNMNINNVPRISYYRLDGTKVSNAILMKGIYIKEVNGVRTKVIVN